jgi:hypothetical protein
MVKFRVGFTIDAETLFDMMAKMLPIADLHVEELAPERPATPVRLVTKASTPRKRRGHKVDLASGANAIVMRLLADGLPHRAIELKPLFTQGGFAANGVGSRLDKLREHGVIFHPEIGLWQIVKKEQAAG